MHTNFCCYCAKMTFCNTCTHTYTCQVLSRATLKPSEAEHRKNDAKVSAFFKKMSAVNDHLVFNV